MTSSMPWGEAIIEMLTAKGPPGTGKTTLLRDTSLMMNLRMSPNGCRSWQQGCGQGADQSAGVGWKAGGRRERRVSDDQGTRCIEHTLVQTMDRITIANPMRAGLMLSLLPFLGKRNNREMVKNY